MRAAILHTAVITMLVFGSSIAGAKDKRERPKQVRTPVSCEVGSNSFAQQLDRSLSENYSRVWSSVAEGIVAIQRTDDIVSLRLGLGVQPGAGEMVFNRIRELGYVKDEDARLAHRILLRLIQEKGICSFWSEASFKLIERVNFGISMLKQMSLLKALQSSQNPEKAISEALLGFCIIEPDELIFAESAVTANTKYVNCRISDIDDTFSDSNKASKFTEQE